MTLYQTLVRRARGILTATVLLFTGVLAPMQAAQAQWVVFDPTNFSQNILTAIRTLQSNVNEITQITNQISQINQGIQNLQQLPAGLAASVLGDNLTQLAQLSSSISSITGLASNIATLTTQFQAQYPNNRIAGSNLTAAQMLAQVNQYLDTARSNTQGAYALQARVLSTLPNDAMSLQNIVSQSQSSNGNLDAVQASNQLLGQVGMQLIKMNQMQAANNQIQADWIGQQQQMMDQNARRNADAMGGWNSVGARTAWTGY
jgi:type IV secretion system protein TrbJ